MAHEHRLVESPHTGKPSDLLGVLRDPLECFLGQPCPMPRQVDSHNLVAWSEVLDLQAPDGTAIRRAVDED
jgi:hypothetical protein